MHELHHVRSRQVAGEQVAQHHEAAGLARFGERRAAQDEIRDAARVERVAEQAGIGFPLVQEDADLVKRDALLRGREHLPHDLAHLARLARRRHDSETAVVEGLAIRRREEPRGHGVGRRRGLREIVGAEPVEQRPRVVAGRSVLEGRHHAGGPRGRSQREDEPTLKTGQVVEPVGDEVRLPNEARLRRGPGREREQVGVVAARRCLEGGVVAVEDSLERRRFAVARPAECGARDAGVFQVANRLGCGPGESGQCGDAREVAGVPLRHDIADDEFRGRARQTPPAARAEQRRREPVDEPPEIEEVNVPERDVRRDAPGEVLRQRERTDEHEDGRAGGVLLDRADAPGQRVFKRGLERAGDQFSVLAGVHTPRVYRPHSPASTPAKPAVAAAERDGRADQHARRRVRKPRALRGEAVEVRRVR